MAVRFRAYIKKVVEDDRLIKTSGASYDLTEAWHDKGYDYDEVDFDEVANIARGMIQTAQVLCDLIERPFTTDEWNGEGYLIGEIDPTDCLFATWLLDPEGSGWFVAVAAYRVK